MDRRSVFVEAFQDHLLTPPLQMQDVLQYVSKRAGFDLPPEAADKIIDDSNGNLRKAILCLEALKMQSYVFPGIVTMSCLLNHT